MHVIIRGSIRRQCGAVLVVSLLILLVMTIIGIVAMHTTTLEEKMAGNTRQRDLAFQAAEAALQDGETDLVKNQPVSFDTSCTNGLCLDVTTSATSSASAAPYWDSAGDWANARNYGAYTGVAALKGLPAPKYLLEKMPPAPVPGENLTNTSSYTGALPTQMYRVTSKATASNGNIVVELQSVYLP
ncbi:MAG: PilX N-terminal domain-containing pilus assembly protein [Gammaproteobacteria bacterium]|jgi:type IV pilus assembly protein PilX